MKRLTLIFLCAALALVAFPFIAHATDSLYVAPTILVPNSGTPETATPTVYMTTPASGFHSGKQIYCVFPAYKFLRPIASGSGAQVITHVIWSDLSAAADSVNCSLLVGPTASGPWTSVYAMGNSTYVATGTTPYVLKAAVALTTLPPMPYWKLTVKAKKTFTAAHKFGFIWPFPQTD